jgi:hypothetical protein
MLRRLSVAAAVALCLLAGAAPALASGDAVIKDCVRNGRLTKQYSAKEYSDALANMPTDVDEYTDCRNIIRHAQLGFGNGGGGGTPPAAGTPGKAPNPFSGATPAEVAAAKRAIGQARAGGDAPRRLGADVVTPGALSYRNLNAVSKLPTPLLVLAILIAAAALAVGGYLVATRVRAGRHSA